LRSDRPFKRRFDHAHRAGHDLVPRADDGHGLLAAQHHLRDFGCIRQVRELGVEHLDAGAGEAQVQLGLERVATASRPARSVVSSASQVLAAVIGVEGRQMADRGLGLDADETV
jgi:hypothetical protein